MSEQSWPPPQPSPDDEWRPTPGPHTPGGVEPAATSQDDRNWAMAAHLGSLVSAWFAFGFIAPLLVMLIKDSSPFVRRHAAESLNFQLSMLIYSVVGGIVAAIVLVLTLGIAALLIVPLGLLVLVGVLAVVVQATVRANNGEDYRYPLTIRFFS